MTQPTDRERAEFEQMRAGYERAFGTPPIGATWSGFGYTVKTFGDGEAETYAERFKGFIAGQAALHAHMAKALETIIALNIQYCIDKHGDTSMAENMECVRVARAALAAAPQPPET